MWFWPEHAQIRNWFHIPQNLRNLQNYILIVFYIYSAFQNAINHLLAICGSKVMGKSLEVVSSNFGPPNVKLDFLFRVHTFQWSLVNYTRKWLKIVNFHDKRPIIKINPRDFQKSFFDSVSIFRKLKQRSLTYLPVFWIPSILDP